MNTDLTPAALDELAGLAAGATPGPWRWAFPGSDSPELMGTAGDEKYSYETDVLSLAPVECSSYCYGGSSRMNLRDVDAAFIATADPATVTALIDEVVRLRWSNANKDHGLRLAIGALGHLVMDTPDDQALNNSILTQIRVALGADS